MLSPPAPTIPGRADAPETRADVRPRRRRKDARPAELLDAALALFVERGFKATRTDDVARRAGVSKGTLYLYFASKEELLKAVVAHHLGRRIADAAELAARHEGPVAGLLGGPFVRLWLGLLDSPASAVFKVMVTEAGNFPDLAEWYRREVIEPGHRLLGGLIERGIRGGEFAPMPVDHAVHSLLLPMIMLCLHRHSFAAGAAATCAAHIDAEAFAAQHVRLVLDGLRPRPLPTPPARSP